MKSSTYHNRASPLDPTEKLSSPRPQNFPPPDKIPGYATAYQEARFLAAVEPHSGDWLFALPVTSCGLRLIDEAVRVAVAMRLDCRVYVAHTCRCGALVDAHGIHGSVCNQDPSKIKGPLMTSLPVP